MSWDMASIAFSASMMSKAASKWSLVAYDWMLLLKGMVCVER